MAAEAGTWEHASEQWEALTTEERAKQISDYKNGVPRFSPSEYAAMDERNRIREERERLEYLKTPEGIKETEAERVEEELRRVYIESVVREARQRVPTLDQITEAVNQIFSENPDQLQQYKSGNKKIVGWMIGKVRKMHPYVDHKQVVLALQNHRAKGTLTKGQRDE